MNKINNLGTYVVRIENIVKTELEQYVNYLLNGDHGNHSERTEIVDTILDKDEYMVGELLKIRENGQRKVGKGGKPLKVSNKALTFNIPKDYEVSADDCKEIHRRLRSYMFGLYRANGYELGEVEIFSNIHLQGNAHINLAIPYLTIEGKTIPFIKSRDRFLKTIAEEFTNITDNVLGTNIKDYMTELDQIDAAEEIMANLADLEPSDIQELKEKHKNNKLVKRTLDYVYRIMNGANENKHIQNLVKTVEKVGKNAKLTQEEYDDLVAALRSNNLLRGLSEEDKKKIQSVKPK